MKMAWLCWYDYDDFEAGSKPEFWTTEPPSHYYKITKIVYTTIED